MNLRIGSLIADLTAAWQNISEKMRGSNPAQSIYRSSSVVTRPKHSCIELMTLVRIQPPVSSRGSSNGRGLQPFSLSSRFKIGRLSVQILPSAYALVGNPIPDCGWPKLYTNWRFNSFRELLGSVAQVRLKQEERYVFNVEDGGSSPSRSIWFRVHSLSSPRQSPDVSPYLVRGQAEPSWVCSSTVRIPTLRKWEAAG